MKNIPPHNDEAEKNILGSMLLSQEAAAIAISQISPDHFYTPANAAVMEAAVELFRKGESVDLVTVANWITEHKRENMVGISYLSSLTDTIPSVAGISGKCKIVKEKAKSRSLIELASNAVGRCFASEPIDEVVSDFGAGFFQVAAEGREAAKIGDVMPDILEKIAETQRSGNIGGLSTGFEALDKRLNGLSRTDLIILAARPSMGKTCLAVNIAENIAERGHKIMVFSLEMGREQLGKRMLSSLSLVSSEAIRKGHIHDDQWGQLTRAAGKISAMNMVIDDTPGLSITELTARAKVEHLRGEISLVVVDYLQLMTAKAGNREQEISAISRGLKGLAKSMNVPVLALSQLNRSLESRADKRPMLSDLRESGAIEQDADIIMFIYRDEQYNPESPAKGFAEIITAKQRNGATGVDKLIFRGEYSRFENHEWRN